MESAAASTVTPGQPILIRRVAVLGAGTMGARIAAHVANAGLPCLLLDMAQPGTEPGTQAGAAARERSKLAYMAVENLLKSRPAACFTASVAARITPGNFDDDLARLRECDWVVEAVTEDLAIKAALLQRVQPHLGPEALLTTNTSGLPVHRIAEAAAMPEPLRRRWFGTHFFNPPRYMKLLEMIPTAETDRERMQGFAAFADRILGKQVVVAHDTPNFIANRIGVANMFCASRLVLEQGLTVEEVDALTGTVLGWPRTGTFRLADMVGIDVLAHVAANFRESTQDQAALNLVAKLAERRWLGDKTKQGFYKKNRLADGQEERLALDLKTLEYRPAQKPRIPALEMAKNIPALAERLRALLAADPAKDKAAAFLWPLLAHVWNYSAERIGEVADSGEAIDRAICAGFNWQMGPFAMWDAVGVAESVARMHALGIAVSPRVEAMLAAGVRSWYSETGFYEPESGQYVPRQSEPGHAMVASFRAQPSRLVRSNPGASLIDLGDGVGCLELHSQKSAIGGDVVAMLTVSLAAESDAVRDFSAFVITSDQENFSVGANLMQLLLAAQEGEWEEVHQAIRAFQSMTAAIKFCPRPVVVAPYALCLGGGAEMALHAAHRQMHAETYMGLVEVGVGLIPGGGGTKEMALRALDAAASFAPPEPRDPASKFAQSAEYAAALKRSLETIAMAKVSTSAAEAREMGLAGARDGITMHRERLLLDAKAQALLLAQLGYTAPQPRASIPAAGEPVLAMLETGIFMMGEAGYASEHDQKVARKVAGVLCGGRVSPGTPISEQTLLDLEREAFLSLCGERKTLERIAHTLKTGKPLRN